MSTLTDGPVEPAEPATVMDAGTADGVRTADDPRADEAGTAPGDRRFRPDVEGLRAVAVGLVVLYHAGLKGLTGGFVGVDVFFVISGFVITGLLLREQAATARTSLLSFYGRRVRRILPAATLVIVATVVATFAFLGVFYGNPTAVAARWTAVFLANFHFAASGTDYLAATQPPSPLQNFWSLAVEEQFYLVFPALVLVVAAWRSRLSLRTRLAGAQVVVIAISLWWSAAQTATNANAAFFSPLTRAWELALGALVAVATPALLRVHRSVGAVATWVGLGAVAFAAVAYSSSTPYPGTAVVVPVVGTALVIAGGTTVPAGGAERILGLGPFQWLGRLSYSLYLWHWPILIIAAEHAGKSSLPFRSNLGWLALSVVASYATYRLIENPVRHAKMWVGRRWLPVVVGVALITTSLVVATVALSTGTAGAKSVAGPSVPLAPAVLQREVAASVHITKIPSNLAPTLAGVRDDWGGPFQPCWPYFGQSSEGTCSFGFPTGTRTIVLYGDSHAAMWFEDLDSIAYLFKLRLVVMSKGDCPAVDLPFANPPGFGTPGGVFTACAKWHEFALRRIEELHPMAVIMTQNPDLGPGGTPYSAAQWQDAMVRTIRSMPMPAADVIVLGNIPRTAANGPECLSRHPNDVQACSGQIDPFTQQHMAAERRAAGETGAGYIDPVPWFCSSTCTDVIGHYQPYWDAFHVTASYARVVGPSLAQALVAQLVRPS